MSGNQETNTMTAHLITCDECSKTIEIPFDKEAIYMPIFNKAKWDIRKSEESAVTYRVYRRTLQRTPDGAVIYREILEPTTTP